MHESYSDYIMRHLEDAENALFEARNAYAGVDDRRARSIDNMRMRIVDYLINERDKAGDGGKVSA